jgi:hypothetical protein
MQLRIISANYAEAEIVFIPLDSRSGNSGEGYDLKESNLCYESVMKSSDNLPVLNQTGGMDQHHQVGSPSPKVGSFTLIEPKCVRYHL